MLLAMTGLLFGMFASEEYYIQDTSEGKKKNEENTACTILRFFVTITTLGLLFCVYNHYYLYLQYSKAKEWIGSHETLWSSGYFKWMVLELFV